MLKELFFLLSIQTVWISYGLAQNLAPNPGFEYNENCPMKMAQFKLCKNWQSANVSGTPDYFYLNCSTANLPDNFKDMLVKPHSGNGYVGIVTFFDQYYSYQEYIQVKLDSVLRKGKFYKVGMYIQLSETSKYYTDRFHFCFSDTDAMWRRWIKGYDILFCNAGILVKNPMGYKDSSNWILVEGDYRATGKEKYLTIGIFKQDLSRKEHKKIRKKNKLDATARSEVAYYFLDDVFVEETP